MAQILIPNQDLSAGSWSGVSGGISSTFSKQKRERPNLSHPSLHDLTGWWRFEAPDRAYVSDLLTNNNRGIVGNGATFIPRGHSRAISFNGTDQYVSFTKKAFGVMPKGTFLIWLYAKAYSGTVLYEEGASYNNVSMGFPANSSSAFSFNLGSNAPNFLTTKASFALDTWYRLAITWDGVNVKSYVDGVLDKSNTSANAPNTTSGVANTQLGRYAYGGGPVAGGYFNGSEDNFQVYNRALSAAEVLQDYFSTNTDEIFGHKQTAYHSPASANLYSTLDEASADEADYIQATTTGACEIAISNPTGGTGTTQTVSYRIGGDGNMTVSLIQIGTPDIEIAAWSHTPVPASPTTYNQELTAPQKALITDYAALKLKFNKTT
jgi:hypothetical protein